MSQSTEKAAEDTHVETSNECGSDADIDVIDDLSSSPSIPDTEIDFEFVYALHTFVATVEGQASATKGDTLILLDDTNSYWWLVRVIKDQSVGYLPAEHIETPEERLARLNKHRNVELSTNDKEYASDEIRKSFTDFLSSRDDRAVKFTGMTYVDAPAWDLSDEFDSVASSSGSLRATVLDESSNEISTNPSKRSSYSNPGFVESVNSDRDMTPEQISGVRSNTSTIAEKSPLLERNYPNDRRNNGESTDKFGNRDANTAKSDTEIASILNTTPVPNSLSGDRPSDDGEVEQTNLPQHEQDALFGRTAITSKESTFSEKSITPQGSFSVKAERRGGRGRIFGSLFKKKSTKKIRHSDLDPSSTKIPASSSTAGTVQVESTTDRSAFNYPQMSELRDSESGSNRNERIYPQQFGAAATPGESGSQKEKQSSSSIVEVPQKPLLADPSTKRNEQIDPKVDLKKVAAFFDIEINNNMVQDLLWIVRSKYMPLREDDGICDSQALRGIEKISHYIQVIDLEVGKRTQSPTVNPSVFPILCAHSMGGILAAETLISLHQEMGTQELDRSHLFPHIIGIIAFDTPFIGINPAVFAHSLYEHSKLVPRIYNKVASHLAALQNIIPTYSSTNSADVSPSRSNWFQWSTVAGAAGAAGAVTAGSIMAYRRREEVSTGLAWINLHLQFVGALFKPEELETRFKKLQPDEGRVVNFYTVFRDDYGVERTFCLLPRQSKPSFTPIVFENVESEIYAHQHIFDNSSATSWLCENMADKISEWITAC